MTCQLLSARRLWRGRISVWLLPLLLVSCISLIKPRREFTAAPEPPAPDYALPASWAALPTTRDSADAVPRNTRLRDQQATASVDVFFVHPTTFFSPSAWNAAVGNESVNRFTDRTTLRKQASVFNNVGRIYAPRYRQATLFSFFDEQSASGHKALELAYTDVRAAFDYYLTHYNQGRPFIIASHSQGTHHATRLLRERLDQNPALRRQLVAAYLVGFNVQPTAFQVLQPCQDSTQTGCYVAWNAVEWGHDYPPFAGGVAVNPLTWTADTTTAPARLNLGGTPDNFSRIDTAVVDAKVHQGLVWVHAPTPGGYPRFLLPGRPELRHSFHIADYALFYLNIRQNAAARVRAFTNQPPRP